MSTIENRRSDIILYCEADAISSHVVRLVVAEKDIAVELELVDPDNKPEDLIHVNPYNSLPTLVDRDLVLYGSRVIVEYLDERYPHPPFMPIDPASRARTRLTLYRIENDWYSMLADIESGDPAKVSVARDTLRESLIASADVFAAKPFFLSDEFSILDVTLAPLLWRLPTLGVDLGKAAPAVTEYAAKVFARPGFQASLSELEREMPAL